MPMAFRWTVLPRRKPITSFEITKLRWAVGALGRGDMLSHRSNPEGSTMPILFYVQGFRQKGRKLEPDQPQLARSSEAAIASAERIAPSRAGVWAYSANVDVEADTYDDPIVLFKSGNLPPGVGD